MEDSEDFQNPVQDPKSETGSVRQGVIKNSFYNVLATLIAKAGGLVFTIILARLLLPELFGVYNLVLSIAMIAITFTDLGISKALVRYTSEALGKNQRTKARTYIRYLFKARITLIIIVVFLIIVSAKFFSENIFNKPEIFLPLLFSGFYILMKSFEGLVRNIFVIVKDLQKITFIQTSLQFFRIVFAVLAILLITDERFVVPGVFVALGIAVFFSIITGLFFLKENRDLVFSSRKYLKSFEEIDTGRIWNYIGLASIATVSLSFFGSIDTIMLGAFVDAEFLGFYRAALGLVVTIAGIFAFSPVLLPLFTQAKNKQLQRGFDEIFRYLSIITIPATIGVLVVAKYFILAVYGSEYLSAAIPLYALAFTIIIKPFTVLYSSLFESKEKVGFLAGAIVVSLISNIILNYALIVYLLQYSQEFAILGAALATVLSRGFYLLIIQTRAKTYLKIKTPLRCIFKPLLSALIMTGALVGFSSLVDMNLFYGILEILLGIIVYFGCLFLLGGLRKQDIEDFKSVLKKK